MKKIKYEILVVLFFVLMRLPSLGHDNFTTDTWKWKSRSYDFGSGVFQLDFEKTLQKYHPGVTLMWIGTAGIKIYNLYYNLAFQTNPLDNKIQTVFELDSVQKFLTVLVIGVGLAYVFFALRHLFGLKYAVISAVVISFEPYYLGLTRVFHLEGLLSVFMLASVVWMYWYFDEGRKSRLIVSGVFAGLSMLTKTTALFLIPFFILMASAKYITEPGIVTGITGTLFKNLKFPLFLRKLLKNFLLWIISSAVVIFALWPALWVSPQEVYKALYRGVAVVGIEREHIQYYFGNLVEDPGPAFYWVVLFFKASPWLLLGLASFLFIYKKLTVEQKKFSLFLIAYSVIYIIAISLPTKKLDRYVMPSLISFALISSVFYQWLWDRVKIKALVKVVLPLFLLVCTSVPVHPDYLSYYNPLAGGLANGIKVLEPKWLIGEPQVVNYFKKIQSTKNYIKSYEGSIEGLIDANTVKNILVVAFPEKYYTQIWPFFREIGAWAVIEDLTAQANYAQYFVYPVWEDKSGDEDRYKLEYDGSVYLRGLEIFKVYKRV